MREIAVGFLIVHYQLFTVKRANAILTANSLISTGAFFINCELPNKFFADKQTEIFFERIKDFMKASLIFVVFLTFLFSGAVSGQEIIEDNLAKPLISARIKSELVRRILIYKFKPAKRPKTIRLAQKGLEAAWLPKISNIEFQLVSEEEIEDEEKDVYFFREPESNGKFFSIGFAFGNPECYFTGNDWNFRVVKNRLKLWLNRGGFGGGCAVASGSGEFKTAGKLNTYPNELAGYKFFDQGKLKNIKLLDSTKADVIKNFGANCDSACDLNDDWTVRFYYFGSISKETTIDDRKIIYVPKTEFVGKLFSIRLSPKRRISFSRISFPSKFSRSNGFSIGENFDLEGGLTASVHTGYREYQDRYGLTYTIFEDIKYVVGEVKTNNRKAGDLTVIEYAIPSQIEDTMFVEQQ